MKTNKIAIIMLIIILIVSSIFICIKVVQKQKNEDTEILEGKVAFEVQDVIVSENEEITINIKMLEDANFVAGNFEFLYDSSKMKYIKHENGEILDKGAMALVNNDESNAKILIAYVGNPENKTNLVEKGELINITFQIIDSISNDKITPQLKCSTLKEKDGNDVKYSIKQGTIIVK